MKSDSNLFLKKARKSLLNVSNYLVSENFNLRKVHTNNNLK
jgi:hypothetical protein